MEEIEELNNILDDILGNDSSIESSTNSNCVSVVPTSTQETAVYTPPSEVPNTESTEETAPSQFSEDNLLEIISDNNITTTSTPTSAGESVEEHSIEEEINEEVSEREAAENEAIEHNESSSPSNNTEESATENTLPQNSPTLLIQDANARFSGMEWFNAIQKTEIILAGLGGIGSNTAYQLSRMNPAKLVLYDDDTVDAVNMAGQLYSRRDVNELKVNAISNMLQRYTITQHIFAIPEKFTASRMPGDIMICGFDSMEARKIFYYSWKNHVMSYNDNEQRAKCLFIDGRLSVDTLQVLCITGTDEYCMKRYEDEFLFSHEEADATICSMKQTTYLACMIGSIIVNLFTNFIDNTTDPAVPYSLPFFTEYNAQLMMFKTED